MDISNLEQEIIEYIDDVYATHAEALKYFDTTSEISSRLILMQDKGMDIQSKLMYQKIPKTPAEADDSDTNNNVRISKISITYGAGKPSLKNTCPEINI